MRLRTIRLLIAAPLLVFGGSFLFAELIPGLFDALSSSSRTNCSWETPYIRQNIALTRGKPSNLGQIAVKPFPAEQDLTFSVAQGQQRDHRQIFGFGIGNPLMDTYAQLQEIRTYYRFLDVDVDRYHLGLLLSAGDASPRASSTLCMLSANAQTWVNLHLPVHPRERRLVMSSVTQKSAEGLPIFYLKDIPPIATGGPPITEPRIYFGQGSPGYVIVKTSTPEFDYPKGKDNAYARFDGADGIPIWRSVPLRSAE